MLSGDTARRHLFDRGLGARKQRHDRSMVDDRGTALRWACRLPQGEPDGGSQGRAFRRGRSPRDGPGRGSQARHDHPNRRRPGTQRGNSRQARDADARCRGTCPRAGRQARRDGQERPTDRRARPVGCPRRPRREDGHARRPQSLAGAPQVTASARGAQAALERLRPLRAQREVSEQQVFEAELAVTSAQILQQTAEAQLHAMLIGPRPEAVAEVEAKIAVADGAVAFSTAHLDLHTIRAPIDGVLDSLTCHPGQTIAIGTPIGEVVDTRQIFVSVYLPARSAQAVHVGQKAQVRIVESRPESSGEAASGDAGLEGKVNFVGRLADVQTGNLPVLILVDNPAGRLTLGQTMGVTITVDEHSGVLEVPSAAILDQGEGPVLSVVRDGKTVALHPELGTSQGGWVAISKTDLKEGEPVIVEGGYNLPEGTAVKTEEAAGKAEGATGKPDKTKAGSEHQE